MYYLGVLLRHFLNGNSINRRCVVQPGNNLIQIHNATIFIERNENKGPVSRLLRIYSFMWPHV